MLLGNLAEREGFARAGARIQNFDLAFFPLDRVEQAIEVVEICRVAAYAGHVPTDQLDGFVQRLLPRSEEHTSELQSLMRISYAVFCLKKTKTSYKQIIVKTDLQKQHS